MVDISNLVDCSKNYGYDPNIDPIDEFRAAIKSAGFPEIDGDIIPDNDFHHWGEPGIKKKPYWYILEWYNDDILTGKYGSFLINSPDDKHQSYSFFSSGHYNLDHHEAIALGESVIEKAKSENEERRKYQEVIARGVEITLKHYEKMDNHEYLSKKQIKPYGLLKDDRGDIVIPMFDINGKIWNYQIIFKDENRKFYHGIEGNKKFQKGAKINGCRFVIHGDNNTILLVEGFATAASCHEATGLTTVVAFNAGNLINVAKDLSGQKFIIIADNDKSKTGEIKAEECVKKYGGKVVLIPEVGMDANDYVNEFGVDKLRELIFDQSNDPLDDLLSMVVTTDFTNALGKEEWYYKDLVQKGSITAIVAEGGCGKTAIFARHVVPEMIKNGCEVLYIDLDSPINDYKNFQKIVQANDPSKYRWISPNTTGQDANDVLAIFDKLIDSKRALDRYVIILDTLKKFADLFSKKEVKTFYKQMRMLNVQCKATLIFLSHSNKSRSPEGELIPEGFGDVRNDVDNMIFLERVSVVDDNSIVSTVVSHNVNSSVKLRGLYSPISFSISKSRMVSRLSEAIDVPKPGSSNKEGNDGDEWSEGDIITEAWTIIKDRGAMMTQKDLVSAIRDSFKPKPGINRLREILSNSVKIEAEAAMDDIFYRRAQKNSRLYGILGTAYSR